MPIEEEEEEKEENVYLKKEKLLNLARIEWTKKCTGVIVWPWRL
jgi:hypothetical protein